MNRRGQLELIRRRFERDTVLCGPDWPSWLDDPLVQGLLTSEPEDDGH